MLNKDFKDLSMGEKLRLQRIMKKQRQGENLAPDEQALYDRFSQEFGEAEKAARSKWPIIILLLVSAVLVVLRNCQ